MPNFSIPQLRPNQIAIVIGAVGVVAVVIIAFLFFRKPTGDVGVPVTLTVWGTEPSEHVTPALLAYKGIRPNVTATYREMNPLTYTDTLVDALAAGEGPDVFTMPSTDVGLMRSKLTPAPSTVSANFLQSNFPKAVETDVTDGGQVYGLPLSLDTLVLLYNRDLLDAAGIVAAPTTWDEVAQVVPRLVAVDDQNQVQRAAIALGGTSSSVKEAGDIVSLLMLQNGAPLTNQAHSSVQLATQGEAALRFYSQFANPASATYTWNDSLGSSYQQLADGKVAMIIAYPSALADIKELNPFADIRVAPVPQATGGTPRSYGEYPILAVSKQSANAAWGWDLVQTMTTNKTIMADYAKATGRTAALTSVIADQMADPSTQVVATQALQARSWFQWDGAGVRREVDRAIADVVSGVSTSQRATVALEQRLRALIR